MRGEIVIDGSKMQVKWNENDARVPRFSLEGDMHHIEWLGKHYFQNPQYFQDIGEIMDGYKDYGKIIKPERA